MAFSGRLGGVVFGALSTGPKGRGFKPGRGDGFLRAIKIRSTPSFVWEVKPDVPCRKISRHVKNPLRYFRYWEAKFSLLRPFTLLATDVSAGRTARELWWTSQELYPAGIITTALHAQVTRHHIRIYLLAEAINPKIFPNMAEAPSVHTAPTRSHHRLLEPTNSFARAIIPTAFVVYFVGSKNRNSFFFGLIPMHVPSKNEQSRAIWDKFLHPTANRFWLNFTLFALPSTCRYLLIHSLYQWF
jgi:hypothetical protein